MSFPRYRVNRIPSRDRDRLTAWLNERDLDLLLRDAPPRNMSSGLRYVLAAGRVAAGDVHVVRPAAEASNADSPLYVLLLESCTNGRWLAVPFGRYSVPAVPGEWATGLKSTPLRVACFWNAREIDVGILLPGAALRLTSGQLDDAVAAYRHVMRGDQVASHSASRFGPPLIHPADPRYPYLDEERCRVDHHVMLRQPGRENTLMAFDITSSESSRWLKAAEGRPGYGQVD